MMEDGLDEHSQISFILFIYFFDVVVSYPHSFQNQVIEGTCATTGPVVITMTFPNTVFSCFHCFSAFFCLFFSPLTLTQLKTELLGSKFNSILEETTVRFLNKPQ